MINKLLKYTHCPLTMEVGGTEKNSKIPITIFDINDAGMIAFNEVFNYIKSRDDLVQIVRTPGGYISKSRINFIPPMYDVRHSNAGVEITLLLEEGCWRFQFRYDFTKHEEAFPGHLAFKKFSQKLQQNGINIWDYKIDNGRDYKAANAPTYIIRTDEALTNPTEDISKALTWTNVHHIDFHNSFPAGLVNCYPEFRSTVEYFYKNRHINADYKGVLNSTVGILWSNDFYGACFSKLAIDAVKDNNTRLENLTKQLEDAGRIPLLWNTDGIWYHGDIYHGPGEGTNLGEWENDHTNCTLRVKSKGSYEFIENGVYTPVVRGRTNLDKIKPREEWQWGDIFSKEAAPLQYGFDYERGVYKVDEEI